MNKLKNINLTRNSFNKAAIHLRFIKFNEYT